MLTPHGNAPALHDQLEQLQLSFATEDRSDPRVRADWASQIERLRDSYRAQPADFSSGSLDFLRKMSRFLQLPPPQPDAPGAARGILRQVFGHESFRPGQEEVIQATLSLRDCVAIMPTGAGKSLTYQIPARILGGTTLVVSPLISLMKDQVDALTRAGLRATFLNSTLTADERRDRVQDLADGKWELVYAAPEGIEASVGAALSRAQINLIAVDEAHCISHWGHDFRPAYRNLVQLKRRLGVPILALTATATAAVTRDIIEQLGMTEPLCYRGSFFRPNLHVSAVRKGVRKASARDDILRLAEARRGQSGIVYCLSRKSTERTAEFLSEHGIPAAAYHAGLDAQERSRVQDAFVADKIDVVVATVAFGMGIDKPDIRYVIHQDMPASIEGYYQEIGRAGRDGQVSDCVLFYSWSDVITHDRLSDDGTDASVPQARERVRQMFTLAEATACRHAGLVGYFDETIGACEQSCDRCTGHDVLDGFPDQRVSRRKRTRTAAPSRHSVRAGTDVPWESPSLTTDEGLFAALKKLRRQLATERKLPAYMVFSDATLTAMARQAPTTLEDMLSVNGVGPKKLDLYGAAFLQVLRASH